MTAQKNPRLKNIPLYMRKEVSRYILNKYPAYRQYFRRCPSCSKFSLKPLENDITRWKIVKERRCAICGFVQKL